MKTMKQIKGLFKSEYKFVVAAAVLLWFVMSLAIVGCGKSNDNKPEKKEEVIFNIEERLLTLPFVATVDKAELQQLTDGVDLYEIVMKNGASSPYSLFVLKVDLKRKDIVLKTLTPDNKPDYALQPLLQMAKMVDAPDKQILAAVNGDFFEWTGRPWGPVVQDGNIIKQEFNAADRNYFAVHKDKTISIGGAGTFFSQRSTIQDAIGGLERVLRSGSLQSHSDQSRHPRTLVGYTEDKEVYLVVVDGRRPDYSIGFSHNEGGLLLRALGAVESLNLDGGGSSTLVVEDAVSKELIVRNRYSDASPRAVANGLAIVKIAD